MLAKSSAQPAGGDYLLLAALAAAASMAAFLYFYRRGEILLYGDAVAHINIARRVFDSRTPGFQQLGTVWLPLPHLLMMPFIVSDWAWRTGVGGSIASMVAFVFGGLGIARPFWHGGIFGEPLKPLSSGARLGGWLAALFYVFNPNMLYLQATAMTESLSLALTIWAIVFYAEFQRDWVPARDSETTPGDRSRQVRRSARSLESCAVVLALGMLTRYDSWLLAVAIAGLLLLEFQRKSRLLDSESAAMARKALTRVSLLTALVPLLWFAYNFGTYGNALEFANGPYSARAIAERSAQTTGSLIHPGFHNLGVAALYFFKDAQLNLCEGYLVAPALLAALIATGALLRWRRSGLALLLWLPLFFYALSVAYGGVPIFMPGWRPFSYYNVRYGLKLLPLLAISAGVAGLGIWQMTADRFRIPALALWIALLAAMYAQNWRQSPICLREARVNSVTRLSFEGKLASILRQLPASSSLLMYTGDHVGVLQQAGIWLRRVTTENNYHLWRNALNNPAESADFIVAVQGDPVWRAVEQHNGQLETFATVEVPGQPAAIVYKSSIYRSTAFIR